jgi:hypothetical protein
MLVFSWNTQIGAEVSRALEAKMAELMGEMELRMNPGSTTPGSATQVKSPDGVSQPSFDHRVDAAISNLEVFLNLNRRARQNRCGSCNRSEFRLSVASGEADSRLSDPGASFLQEKIVDAPSRWQRDWDRGVNRMSSRSGPTPKSYTPKGNTPKGNGKSSTLSPVRAHAAMHPLMTPASSHFDTAMLCVTKYAVNLVTNGWLLSVPGI